MADTEILTVPPVEAIEHFRAKGYHVGFDWRDTAAGQHVASFTAAKAMRLDILEDIREAVDEAIAEGITFRQFQQRLEPILRARGWWGQQEMVDPLTGERRLVQLGSPRRLRIIYDTNIRMATAHGRWARIERLKEYMPYLRYSAVLDARTRPEHAAWHGTVLPVDHHWWKTHYPPNGWHCRCIVMQLSADDLDRYGFEVSKDPGVTTRPWTNRRSGEIVQVPRGIDPGFSRNVGLVPPLEHAARILSGRIADASAEIASAAVAVVAARAGAISNLNALPADVARERVRLIVASEEFREHLSGTIEGHLPVAVVEGNLATALDAGHAVQLSRWTAAKQLFRHDDIQPGDYGRVQRIFDDGIIYQESPRHLIGYLYEDGRWWRTVVKSTRDGIFLSTYHRVTDREVTRAGRRYARLR